MQVLLENRWQARKVRWITWAFAVWAVGWVYWAWTVAETYGLSPGDGGVLRPLPERLGVAAGMVCVGVLPLAGMMLYLSIYLRRIERDGDAVVVTVLGLFASAQHRYRVADFEGAGRHDGQLNLRSRVNAPWLTLRVAGRRLPYIVDVQAERVEVAQIVALGEPKRKRRT